MTSRRESSDQDSTRERQGGWAQRAWRAFRDRARPKHWAKCDRCAEIFPCDPLEREPVHDEDRDGSWCGGTGVPCADPRLNVDGA